MCIVLLVHLCVYVCGCVRAYMREHQHIHTHTHVRAQANNAEPQIRTSDVPI